MNSYISFILKQKLLVLFFAIMVIIAGVVSWNSIPIDAFPDVTNTQVMVLSEVPGMSAIDVEKLVTFPIEIEISGLPDIKMVRSTSKFGLSQVVVIFEDNVDTYFARQLVFERLQSVAEQLPEGIEPKMGPVSTGLGEIYQYTLESEENDLTELRTVQDWVIKPRLRSVPGVTEVNSFGGYTKQYQVIIDPERLIQYDLILGDVMAGLTENNANAPANYIVKEPEQIVVRGLGLIRSIEDIENIVITSREGIPVYISDIAQVQIGHEIRWGTVTRDGKGEVVCGMVIMLKGANSQTVVDDVKKEISLIQKSLPEGIKINPFYDRTELIKACIDTVSSALFQGGILVIIMLVLFLGSFRTALVVSLSLPFSALICFIAMRVTGLSANLISLGGLAIAIGMIVDANIVIAENIHRHITHKPADQNIITTCQRATTEVAKPVLFSILIIIFVFIPLFSLQGVEGKMFKPLALTLMFAMGGSLIAALTITPVLGAMIIKGSSKSEDNFFIKLLKSMYIPVLETAIKYKKTTVLISLVVFICSLFLFKNVGTEFLPYLDEGAIAINVVKYPTVSLTKSRDIATIIEKELIDFPEIKTVISKTGRADIAEDPMGPEQNDIFIMLKSQKEWDVSTKQELIEKIDNRLGKIPGIKLNITQPIALRVNELISGIKSDVAIKVFGYDLDLLGEKAEEIEHIVAKIEGATHVKVEQITGFLQLDIVINRKNIARYGINVNEINEIIETAIGGKTVGTVYEDDRRFGLLVRFPEENRKNEKTIGNILVSSPEGQRIPLRQLADIKLIQTPNQISRENGVRRIVIECNVRDRDIGSFVEEAQKKIAKIENELPSGYYIKWGGQFENQQRAMKKLMVVVPIVIFLIFVMLFSAFNGIKPALLVILNLPFALVGGIISIILFKVTLSVSAVVGFIALFGIAVENGIVLVSFFIQLRKEGLKLHEAIIKGCELRFRPLLLTSLTTILGLTPLLIASGPGSEMQKPLAIVVLGGLVSALFLTLIVLPAIYGWFEKEETEF